MQASKAESLSESEMYGPVLMSLIKSMRERIAELGFGAPLGAIRGFDIALETVSRYGVSSEAEGEMKARASSLEGFDSYRNQCSGALYIAATLCNLFSGSP
jgi:hypothetical protein